MGIKKYIAIFSASAVIASTCTALPVFAEGDEEDQLELETTVTTVETEPETEETTTVTEDDSTTAVVVNATNSPKTGQTAYVVGAVIAALAAAGFMVAKKSDDKE